MTDSPSINPAELLRRGKEQALGDAPTAALAILRQAYDHAAEPAQQAEARRWLWLASVRNVAPAVFSNHQQVLLEGLEALQRGEAGAARSLFQQVVTQSEAAPSPLLWLRGEAMALYVQAQLAANPPEQLQRKLPKFQQDIEPLGKTTRSYPDMGPLYAAWLTNQAAIVSGVAPVPPARSAPATVALAPDPEPPTSRLDPPSADPPAAATPTAAAPAAPARPRLTPRRMALIGVAAALIALCGAYGMFAGAASQPTPVAAVLASPAATRPAAPVALIATPAPAPTARPTAAPVPTARPTATPEPVTWTVAQVETTVNTVFSGATFPITFTLPITASSPAITRDDVQATRFELRGPDGRSLSVGLRSVRADALELELAAFPEGVGGASDVLAAAPQAGWTLAIDGAVLPAVQFAFGETRTIRGVTAENALRREPLFGGRYAFPYSEPSQQSTRLKNSGLLNDELLDILEVRDGWYRVRVRTNSDPAVLNQEFWVLRWIVDNVDVPPTPTPQPEPTPTPRPPARNPNPPAGGYRAGIGRNYPEVQGRPSGAYQSCITGRVTRKSGAGVGGAVGNVNNGSSRVGWTTNAAGEFAACGLGYSNWAVVLDYVPPGSGSLNGQVVVSGVWVNGNADQIATVSFQER